FWVRTSAMGSSLAHNIFHSSPLFVHVIAGFLLFSFSFYLHFRYSEFNLLESKSIALKGLEFVCFCAVQLSLEYQQISFSNLPCSRISFLFFFIFCIVFILQFS